MLVVVIKDLLRKSHAPYLRVCFSDMINSSSFFEQDYICLVE